MKSPRLKNCRKDSNVTLKPGDVTWVKVRGFSWWPAQVVDENSVSENCRPRKKIKRAVLLRLYGSYEYIYQVEPRKSLMEFKNMLEHQNCSCRDMIQKAIDQVMLNSSDESDNNSDSEDKSKELAPEESSKKVEKVSLPSRDFSKRSECLTKRDDALKKDTCEIPVPIRIHLPSLQQDLPPLEKTTDYSARRLKVMQSLGLMAPSGSPFFRNGHIQPVE